MSLSEHYLGFSEMQNEFNILWAECQQILRDNLSQSAYQTWFAPINAVQWQDDVLVLQVKSQFIVEYIEENYLDILSRVLRKVFGNKVQLEYRVLIADSAINVPSAPTKAIASQPTAKMVETTNSTWDSQLNEQYTFDNFVKGEPNKLARAAAVEIAKNPGKTIFNPLFLFGGSGVGKTHLAYAIGNEVCRLNPEARVLYVAANTFKLQFQELRGHVEIDDSRRGKRAIFVVDCIVAEGVNAPRNLLEFRRFFAEHFRKRHFHFRFPNAVVCVRFHRDDIPKRVVVRRLAVGVDNVAMITGKVGRNIKFKVLLFLRVRGNENFHRIPAPNGVVLTRIRGVQPTRVRADEVKTDFFVRVRNGKFRAEFRLFALT